MQLFTTKIDDIQSKIEALQVEAAKLQDLENATASSLANLKAVVANIKDDETTLATLKSAINSLFEPFNSSQKIENEAYSSDLPTEQTQDKAAENDAEISNQIVCDSKAQAMKMCQHFKNSDLITDCQISDDELAVEFSFKKTDSDLVGKLVYEFESNCTARNAPGCAKSDFKSDLYRVDESALAVIHERELRLPVMAVKVAQLVKEHYHKVEVKDGKFIGYNPHDFSETQLDEIISEFNSRKPIRLSEQAQWDSQTDVLYIWFKLKKTLKIWAEHYNVAHEDAIIRDQSDSSKEGYKYLLTVLRSANVDHTEWMTQQGQFDFSKTPQENRQQLIEDNKQQLDTEKYHILIQKNQESETVEIESSDEAFARKNYSSLVESIPDSYIHLMSDKRGCIETHKPSALSFMAAGMGWLNVIHNGEVLGMIYSDKTGWELETGEKFETREEAALAMLNLSSVAA